MKGQLTMIRKMTVPIITILICCSSCAVVTIPLIPPPRPLREQVIAGEGADKILMLDISGTISTDQESHILGIKKEPGLVERIKEELELAQQDEHIKALLLKIDSPGGMVTASDILHHEISRFKTRTGAKVVACLMGVSTSGAYYVAAGSDKIIAHPTTVTGSIGVIIFKLNLTGLMEKVGIGEENIKSGEMKDILLPLRPITKEEREVVQQIVSQMQERFLQIIRQGRPKITEEQLKQAADGRILSSHEALNLGLIDQIGYLDDAIESAKQLAGLTEAKIIVYTPPQSYKKNIYTQAETQTKGFILQQNYLPAYLSDFLPGPSPYFMYQWIP
jgi:protease-4